MLSYHLLKQKPRVLRAFTSLDPEEFDTLLIPFEQAWESYVTQHYRHKTSRKRRYGGGRKPHLLAIEDKLLFIVFYFKVYPLQEVLAAFFGMSQARANEWIHKLTHAHLGASPRRRSLFTRAKPTESSPNYSSTSCEEIGNPKIRVFNDRTGPKRACGLVRSEFSAPLLGLNRWANTLGQLK